MGDFKYQDSLVHFVFANRDTYYLESMVRLNLADKLYRELSGQGYRKIIFLKRGIQPCVLETKDRASYEFCCTAAKKKALFGFRKGTEIPEYSGQDVERTDEELRAMLAEARGCAFVVRIELFAKLFSGHADQLAALVEENSQNRNVIDVISSVRAGDSLPYFRDPEGILQNERIFPEIRQAFSDENCREGRAYELLRVYLQDRCHFYNSLSRYSVTNTVRWTLWNCHKVPEENIDELTKKIAAFVYTWYHSPALRRKYPDCLSANEERRYAELSRTLERRLAVILRDMENFREEDYPSETENVDYILGDSPVYMQLKSIRIPAGTRDYDRWERLVREYAKPRGGTIPKEIFQVLRFAAEYMGRAVQEGDPETVSYTAACLEYGARSRFETGGEAAHIWELRKNCIEISSRRFDMERRIAEKRERIQEWRAEWSRLTEAIEKKRRSRVPENDLYYEKELALDLYAKIESYKKVIFEDQRESATFRRLLNQMELMISSEKLYQKDADKLEKILTVSRDAIFKYAKEKAEENQRIQQVQYDLDDLISLRAGDSVTTRFDQMLNRAEKDRAESEAEEKLSRFGSAEVKEDMETAYAEDFPDTGSASARDGMETAVAEAEDYPNTGSASARDAMETVFTEAEDHAESEFSEERGKTGSAEEDAENESSDESEDEYPEYELPDDLTEMLY